MSGYSCRSGVICHSSELHQPRQGEERQYILIRGSGKLRPTYQLSYSSSYAPDPPDPAAPSSGAPASLPLCGSDLISHFLLFFFLFLAKSFYIMSFSIRGAAFSTMIWFLSALHVMAVLSPACCVLANSLWPWSSVWLAVFLGGGLAEMEASRLPPPPDSCRLSVCLSLLPYAVISLIAVRTPHWACPLSIRTLIGVITA